MMRGPFQNRHSKKKKKQQKQKQTATKTKQSNKNKEQTNKQTPKQKKDNSFMPVSQILFWHGIYIVNRTPVI